MNYRISDLKNFVEIAAVRTMRDGADKLGITQPSLSESIKRLEQDLGEILFYRSRSGISLTPGGQKYLKLAKEALAALEALGKHQDGNDSRLITIGCHPTVASYFLPEVFRSVQKENPSFQVRLRHDLSRVIQLEVQQGKVDIGIVVNVIPAPDLVVKQLAQDEVCIWRSTRPNEVKPDKIFCNLALFQTQDLLRRWKDRPTNIVDTDSLELIVRFANEGLGYGIAPARALTLIGAKHCERAPKTPVFHDTFSVIYRPEFGKHPVEKSIIEGLKRSVK